MNADACEALDLIEHTLQDDCYFMSGIMQQCVASRSTPPPERWFAARERERQRALALAAERRRSRSRTSSRSVATATPAPRTAAKTPSSVTPRAPRTCQQCGLRSDRCDGAKPQKGGSDNCSFKCTRCGVGPLRCQCCTTIKTTTPAPTTEGRSVQSVKTGGAIAFASAPLSAQPTTCAPLLVSADKENAVQLHRSVRLRATGGTSAPNPTFLNHTPNAQYGSRKRAALISLDYGNAKEAASIAPDSSTISCSSPSTDESDDDDSYDDETWEPVVKRARIRLNVPLCRQRSNPNADCRPFCSACQRGAPLGRCPACHKSSGSPPLTPLEEERTSHRSTAGLLSVIRSSREWSSWSPLSRGSADRAVATAATLPVAARGGATPAYVSSSHPQKIRKPRTCRGCGKGKSECRGGVGGLYGGRDRCNFKCRVCDRGPLLCICRGHAGGASGGVGGSGKSA